MVCLFVHNHNIFCLSQKNKPQSRKAVIKLMGTHIHTPFILPKKICNIQLKASLKTERSMEVWIVALLGDAAKLAVIKPYNSNASGRGVPRFLGYLNASSLIILPGICLEMMHFLIMNLLDLHLCEASHHFCFCFTKCCSAILTSESR